MILIETTLICLMALAPRFARAQTKFTAANAETKDAEASSPNAIVSWAFECNSIYPQTPIAWPEKARKPTFHQWRLPVFQGLRANVVTLYNIHTREALPVFPNRRPPLSVIEDFFRCRGFATSHRLDPRLLDIMLEAARHFQSTRIEVISGYRSPKFNDALAKKGRRVASESKHTEGRAVDFSLEDIAAIDLGKWLWANFDGGVGIYTDDGFVHVDTGTKRKWWGK